jgi:hypothetical protein
MDDRDKETNAIPRRYFNTFTNEIYIIDRYTIFPETADLKLLSYTI